MKLAIINDTHFGARNDSQIFLDYFLDFFENQFFPYCKENKITDVIHLGDFFDRRKFINFHTLAETKKRFLDRLSEYDITLHCVLGNHLLDLVFLMVGVPVIGRQVLTVLQICLVIM